MTHNTAWTPIYPKQGKECELLVPAYHRQKHILLITTRLSENSKQKGEKCIIYSELNLDDTSTKMTCSKATYTCTV